MASSTNPILKRFAAYYRPHRALFTLDLVTAGLRSCFIITIPFLVVRMLSKEQLAQADLHDIWTTIGIIGVLILLMALAEFINVKWGHILGTRIETDRRSDHHRREDKHDDRPRL